MPENRLQFRLWMVHVAVACVALVLGAAHGGFARFVLAAGSVAFVVAMAAAFLCACVAGACYGASTASRWGSWLVQIPTWPRQMLFERRLARIRPGNSSQLVRRILGAPAREDGFGDRLYWSYRIAGQRYTVSFDPRRLVAKYTNSLARDVPARSEE